jgi:ribosomal protein L30
MAATKRQAELARGLLRAARPVEPKVGLMRVTLVKSHCSARVRTRETLLTLGLKRPHDSVVHKNNSATRGKLFNVRNYIHVQEVPLPEGYVQPRAPEVVSRVLGTNLSPEVQTQLLRQSRVAPSHARVDENVEARNAQITEEIERAEALRKMDE